MDTSVEIIPSKKPKINNFYQQNLPAWQPMITAGSLYPYFFGISILFIPIGIILIVTTHHLTEIIVPYTDCKKVSNPNVRCSSEVLKPDIFSNYSTCPCDIEFKLEKPMLGQVYLYYALTNYHQNHRRYFNSKDGYQMLGRDVIKSLSHSCEPYRYANVSGVQMSYAPCGAIANTLFNDTFTLYKDKVQVPMTKEGIAWMTDKTRKFGKPENWNDTVKPINWPIPAFSRSPDAYSGDEELLVWMRAAATPSFKKLNRIIQHDKNPDFKNGLPVGNYRIRVDYAYPVTMFDGTKSVVLSTTNAMGGKNVAMGALYMAMGLVAFVLAVGFVILDKRTIKRPVELERLHLLSTRPVIVGESSNSMAGSSSTPTA